MTDKNIDATESIKKVLGAQAGGAASDWKRLSRKSVMWGDIDREFENKKTGEKVTVSERSDGLLYAERNNGEKITARLSSDFNATAKPSVVDQVMNMILESADEIDDALYARAVKEGLVRNFKFMISEYDDGDQKTQFALIYPASRDATLRVAAYIRPMVPELDSQDECMEDIFLFRGEETSDPAKLAAYLTKQGVQFDDAGQKRLPEIYDAVKAAVDASAKTQDNTAKAKGPRR